MSSKVLKSENKPDSCHENNREKLSNTENSFKISSIKMHKPLSAVPKRRTDVIKWNGWGYNDSRFIVKDGMISFTGKRYSIGENELPYFTEWAKASLNVDTVKSIMPIDIPSVDHLPKATINEDFLNEICNLSIDHSLNGFERLIRSHGQTLHDIYTLRRDIGSVHRIPDIVLWPRNHEEVLKIVPLADKHNVVIIPFGGGTSVSGAVSCPELEKRSICALDTSQMNNIIWLDEKNLLVCCQAGLIGQDLEAFLNQKGFTCGHEPDSYEFSSVGGWVATRASGMKKNVYGNIEDLLVSVKLVTPKGVLSKEGLHPRQSTGPDLNHIVLGSEGTLGVITEVILKVRPVANYKKYGSIVFPYFDIGVAFMREVAKQRCQPASIRLMDNEQFQFGQSLRPKNTSYWSYLTENIKKAYLRYVKGFDLNKICVVTLLFEGEKDEVIYNENLIYKIAKEYSGIPAGEHNGERGYMLTFVIAYIRVKNLKVTILWTAVFARGSIVLTRPLAPRFIITQDLGLDFNVVAESFETSVPWDKTLTVCRNVKYVIGKKCKELGIKYYLISHRVTQTYDCGSCVYFYFAFNWEELSDPVGTYESIETVAREEILRCGGSLSHHHGVGKLRARWFPHQVSQLGANLYQTTKQFLDPNNVFACQNLLPLKSNL